MSNSGRIGPGASTILMILAVLVMTMLGVLALTGARNDLTMSLRMEQAAQAYYAAETEFSRWTMELDNELIALRKQAGEDAETYARLVRERWDVTVGDTLDYNAPVDETRLWHARVQILPLSETDRFLVVSSALEANPEAGGESGEEWSLIA